MISLVAQRQGALLSSTEMALFELMEEADMAPDSHFRQISMLLKQQ